MPDTAVSAALTSLLPSLPASNKSFPPRLISHCESLLALSRQRASTLKPEEEIARAHACSEIACTRLRAQLRLPVIKHGVGAPCQPKVYARLLKYLEKALEEPNAGSSSTRGTKRDGDGNEIPKDTLNGRKHGKVMTPRKPRSGMDKTSPGKHTAREMAGTRFTGTVKNTRKSGSGEMANGIDDKAPAYVMPAIRTLCRSFATPSLAPHVYTGTCITLKLADIWSSESQITDELKANILSLVTALYLMVLTRMQEDQMTTETYTQVSARCIDILDLRGDAVDSIEKWINRLNDEGWCSGEDWWDSVPESVLAFDLQTETAGGDPETLGSMGPDYEPPPKKLDLQDTDPGGVLLPGLGTMLHDAIDWTSEDKCSEYSDWLARIMKELSTPSKSIGRRNKAAAAV